MLPYYYSNYIGFHLIKECIYFKILILFFKYQTEETLEYLLNLSENVDHAPNKYNFVIVLIELYECAIEIILVIIVIMALLML